MIKTTSTLPPEISQHFNRNLLHLPYPKFYDDSERLWKIYLYIKNKLKRKCMHCPYKLDKYEKLEKEFLELYERVKEKEKDVETKTDHPCKGFGYFFTNTNKYHKWLYDRLRKKS